MRRVHNIKKENYVLEMFEDRKTIFFVDRYSWSHSGLRKLTRKMCRNGVLVKLREDDRGFVYAKKLNNCSDRLMAGTTRSVRRTNGSSTMCRYRCI